LAPELRISALSFQYWKDSPKALTNVNVTIAPGTICTVLGPTNAGKTTLLQAIAGVLGNHHQDAVASGRIVVGEEQFEPLPGRVLFPTVGLTLQDPSYQISGLRETVFDEVSLTLDGLAMDNTQIQHRATSTLTALGLAHLAHRKPSTLSGGELQQVALANILVARPPVLLLDEPSNSLDGIAQRRLASIICALRGDTTVLLADYQLEFALLVADQFVVLDGGSVVFSGTRSAFLDALASFEPLLPSHMLEEALRTIPASSRRNNIMKSLGR
jgi:energy-coupling factor transporter ATP-binding protein EcfA2